ncbi:MAG: hypothetical protein AAFR59_15660, partial [Bacteroidota bacterium]
PKRLVDILFEIAPHPLSIMMIKMSVIMPMVVEKIPVALDLVQPSSAIMTAIEIIPNKKEIPPKRLGKTKSLLATFKGKPSVVIRKTFVIAKMATKNAPVDSIEMRNIWRTIFLGPCLSNSNNKTVSENPHSNALMNCI